MHASIWKGSIEFNRISAGFHVDFNVFQRSDDGSGHATHISLSRWRCAAPSPFWKVASPSHFKTCRLHPHLFQNGGGMPSTISYVSGWASPSLLKMWRCACHRPLSLESGAGTSIFKILKKKTLKIFRGSLQVPEGFHKES